MEVLFITKERENPINEQIRAKEMMVIGPNGEQLGIKSTKDAITLSTYAGFDLVMINPNGNPPVCKVMYYNKYNNPTAAPIEGPSHPVWYKYTFDDDVLYITSAEYMNATPTKKYYRFEGDKLYLSNEQGGFETCYSTIKLE